MIYPEITVLLLASVNILNPHANRSLKLTSTRISFSLFVKATFDSLLAEEQAIKSNVSKSVG